MKILIIGGVPGVGKTSFMRSLIAPLEKTKDSRHGLLDYSTYKDAKTGRFLNVLGRYQEGETFAGTDRLSMAVQPHAQNFIAKQSDAFDALPIALEGDRLFNVSFVDLCRELGNEVRVLLLHASAAEIENRRRLRSGGTGKVQDETWLAGRKTKVANVSQLALHRGILNPVCVETLPMAELAATWYRMWLFDELKDTDRLIQAEVS